MEIWHNDENGFCFFCNNTIEDCDCDEVSERVVEEIKFKKPESEKLKEMGMFHEFYPEGVEND